MRDLHPAIRGWLELQRARLLVATRPVRGGRGGQSLASFYARNLRYSDLAFDIGANEGQHTEAMLNRGARVVAVEPQAELARSLRRHCPKATVLSAAVGDERGSAILHTSHENHTWATISDAWIAESGLPPGTWDAETLVPVTTIDALIHEFGEPAFIKLDVEGVDDRALAGLSRPVERIMFEVHAAAPEVAANCFDRLAELGSYEYRLMERESWYFGPPTPAKELLRMLPKSWGDVYGRRVAERRAGRRG